MVAVLWGGTEAVASHRTAAELFGIDGIRDPNVLDITVRRGSYPRADDVVTHRSRLLIPGHVMTLDSIPVTTPVRILLDSGTVVGKEQLELGVEDVLRRGYSTHDRIMMMLERAGGIIRPGARPLADVMLARDPTWAPLESVLEDKTFDLIHKSDLPDPERQYWVAVRGKRFRIDLCYPPPIKLAIEPSGFRWHTGRLRWGVDQRRIALLTSLGYGWLPVTWGDVTIEPFETLGIIHDSDGR